MRALLLDIGGVVLRSAHEMMERLGRRHPELAPATDRRGRLGPVADRRWELALSGELAERAYWAERAAEVGELNGGSGSVPALMDLLYRPDDDGAGAAPGQRDGAGAATGQRDIMRPAARALMADARAAGRTVAALTNDLAVFHGDDPDVSRHPVLGGLDPLVDGSVTGVLKPDPEAYRTALAALGRAAGDVVFVDDMPVNVEGARAVGLATVWVDLADPDAAFERARDLLGLERRAA